MTHTEIGSFTSDPHRIYDAMLRIQAEMAYPFERPLFQHAGWKRAKSVLDFGCGNGRYLQRLLSDFPDKKYIGVEIDPQMRAAAKALLPTVTIHAPDEELGEEIDAFHFRLVFMHIRDRAPILEMIRRTATRRAVVIVIEAEDRHFEVDPVPPRFEAALMALRGKAVDRNVAGAVEDDLQNLGFRRVERLELVPNSTFPHARGLISQYMWLSAALGLVESPDPVLADEILAWLSSTAAYVQFGEVTSIYER
jgi:SAM-dependent methyltransferase